MADAYLGEIRIFAGNFAPKDWALCNGQLIPITQNMSLFSLLGVMYGGDGRTNFALPNLQGRAPMHFGSGAGLTPRQIGDSVGASAVTLRDFEIPAHTHGVSAQTVGQNDQPGPTSVWSKTRGRPSGDPVYVAGAADTAMNPMALATAGGSNPHNNMQPYTGLNFIICLNGYFPPRG